jgi:hypothetical protein
MTDRLFIRAIFWIFWISIMLKLLSSSLGITMVCIICLISFYKEYHKLIKHQNRQGRNRRSFSSMASSYPVSTNNTIYDLPLTLLRRMHAAGHQIASHTWSHADLSTQVTPAQRKNEMYKNEMALRNILGFIPTYMVSKQCS